MKKHSGKPLEKLAKSIVKAYTSLSSNQQPAIPPQQAKLLLIQKQINDIQEAYRLIMDQLIARHSKDIYNAFGTKNWGNIFAQIHTHQHELETLEKQYKEQLAPFIEAAKQINPNFEADQTLPLMKYYKQSYTTAQQEGLTKFGPPDPNTMPEAQDAMKTDAIVNAITTATSLGLTPTPGAASAIVPPIPPTFWARKREPNNWIQRIPGDLSNIPNIYDYLPQFGSIVEFAARAGQGQPIPWGLKRVLKGEK
jgi:hypothetical protein